jgi:hypothetical protein
MTAATSDKVAPSACLSEMAGLVVLLSCQLDRVKAGHVRGRLSTSSADAKSDPEVSGPHTGSRRPASPDSGIRPKQKVIRVRNTTHIGFGSVAEIISACDHRCMQHLRYQQQRFTMISASQNRL